MSKVTVKEWYRRVGEGWPDGGLPILSPEEAKRAAKKLYRFAMKRTWTGEVEATSGNRVSWVRGGVLVVNPERGWAEMVHNLSHYFHWRLNPTSRPHGGQHARLELRCIKEVVRRGWLTGSLKPKEKPPAAPAHRTLDTKLERARANLARAVTRSKRAQTILKKWERRVRIYERRAQAAQGQAA